MHTSQVVTSAAAWASVPSCSGLNRDATAPPYGGSGSSSWWST
ncbi:hypothetical protein AB0L30_11320 [Microbispora rosea]